MAPPLDFLRASWADRLRATHIGTPFTNDDYLVSPRSYTQSGNDCWKAVSDADFAQATGSPAPPSPASSVRPV